MLNEMLKTVFNPRIHSGKKMKKAIVVVILFLLYSTFLLAQVDTAWVQRYNGPGNSTDAAYALAVDGAGNVYVTGRSWGSGGSAGTGYDYATIKYTPTGDTLWVRRYNGPGNDYDYALALAVDGTGNVYVTGWSEGSGTGDDYATIKYNSDGDTLWLRRYNGPGNGTDQAKAIAVDGTGNVYVTGRSKGSGTGYDYATIKYTPTGDTLWLRRYNGPGNDYDYALALAVDGTGNVYVTGWSEGSGTGDDYATIKYTPTGDTTGLGWVRRYNAPGNVDDDAQAIAVDGTGNVYVTGWSKGFGTDRDYVTIKYTPAGDTLWVRRYNGPVNGRDQAHALAVDGTGNVFVTGYSAGSGTSYDYATIKYTPDGDTAVANGGWVQRYNGPGNSADQANALAVDGTGNVYVTGNSAGSGPTGYDYATIKYNSAGDALWVIRYNAGDGGDYAYALAVDGTGNVYVTGESLTASTDYDYATIKYVQAGITGDFNGDGYVDAADLQLLGDHWHFVDTDPGWDPIYDLVPDGIIDAADLQVFGDHWHEGTPPTPLLVKVKDGKGPNENAGIVFDLDATTSGNQNLTSIPSQPVGTMIRLDVYCTGVNNLDTYEFEVIYNPTELTYVTSTPTNPITFEGNILESNGGTAVGWMVDTSTPGVLSLAYTLTGTDPAQAPEGEGLIADIVFQALVNTYGTLSFGDVYYYDSYGVVDLITDTGTATLPVELSSFTAAYNTVSGFVSLFWETASETDVNGFNIYRNTEDSLGEADKINIDLIAGSGTTTETTEYSFTDETADPYYTTYYYWLQVINFSGTNDEFGPYKYIPVDVNHDGELGIITSTLSPCYPNPARIGNEIKFNFRAGGLEGTARNVELKVYNILGKLVAEVVNGERLVNDYTETWTPDNLSNGVYFYQLKTENYSEVKKMMIQ